MRNGQTIVKVLVDARNTHYVEYNGRVRWVIGEDGTLTIYLNGKKHIVFNSRYWLSVEDV